MSIADKFKNRNRVDYINYLILVYAFVLSFPVAIKTPILIIMIFLWISDRNKSEFMQKDVKRITIWMLLFFSLILLSIFWSDADIKDIFTYIKKFWYFLPIFIIYRYIKREYIAYALSSFLLGMLISEILSYGVFFSLWKIRFATPLNPSIFLHHIQYSIFLSLTSIILFFRGVQERDKRVKFIYYLFFTTVTLNLFINIGRTGYITFLAGFSLSLLSVYRLKIKAILAILVITIVSIVAIYNISPNFQKRISSGMTDMEKLSKKGNFNTSIGARLALWIAAEEIFKENPIFGVGVAEHIDKKNKFAKKSKKFEFLINITHFHNSFLEILTQFGIVGLSIFLYILYLIVKIPIQNTELKIIKISLFTIFILGSFADRLFHLNSTMSLFSLMVGIIFAQYRFENQKADLKYAV